MKSSFEEITSATNNSNQPKDALMPDRVKAQMKEYLKACMVQEKEIAKNRNNINSPNSNLFQLDFDFLKQDRTESPAITKNKTQSRRKTGSYTNDFYSKEKERKKSTEKKLEDIRFKQAQAELNQLKDKPSINHKSRMLTKNKPPLHKRLNEIESHHRKKLQIIQENITQDSKRRAQSNRENIIPNAKSKQHLPFEQWFEMNNEWENCRKNKLEYLKQEIDQFENEDDELCFHPRINSKSKEIVERKYKRENTIDRLYNCHKSQKAHIERKIREMTPSFTPLINKHYPINKEYYSYMAVDQQQIYNSQFK